MAKKYYKCRHYGKEGGFAEIKMCCKEGTMIKAYSFQEKLDRIYDELWGMADTTSLGAKDDEDRMKLLDLIDNILGR